MSCWQGDAGPILNTAAEERTQKSEKEIQCGRSGGGTHDKHSSSAFQNMALAQEPYLIITV